MQDVSNSPYPPEKISDVEVVDDEELDFDGVNAKFRYFPTHCPECSAIESGDETRSTTL